MEYNKGKVILVVTTFCSSDLYGKNNDEMSVVDQIVDTCVDMYDLLVSAFFEEEGQKVTP